MKVLKSLSIRILHLALLGCSLLSSVYIFINLATTKLPANVSKILLYIDEISTVIALFYGFIYLVFGYKKDANKYFNMYMIALTCAFTIKVVCFMSIQVTPIYLSFLYIIPLVLLSMLAGGKDFGKDKSYVFVIIILACRCIVLLIDAFRNLGELATVTIINDIAYILLAGTTVLMVVGKYEDKQDNQIVEQKNI